MAWSRDGLGDRMQQYSLRRGAYYVLMAAKQDMIGIHSSTGGSTVAAPGGKGRLVGNNVLAFAAPGRTMDCP